MPSVRLLFTMALLAVALFAIPATANAAPGDLTQGRCVANSGYAGCATPAINAMQNARSVAISPDGTSVYVTGQFGLSTGTLNHFTRAANGTLTQIGCYSNNGENGCVDIAHPSLAVNRDVVISPDGKNVYVLTGAGITKFDRAADGTLTENACVAVGIAGCTDFGFSALVFSAESIAVSPDGSSVYAVFNDDDEGGIVGFDRAADGDLTEDFCWSNHGGSIVGCSSVVSGLGNLDVLHEVSGVVVSPDGSSVYVSSRDRSGDDLGSVTHFQRAANGTLTSIGGCTADNGLGGCTNPVNDSLGGASDVAVSPDGLSVYVTAQVDHSVTQFSRAADGVLTQVGCFANAGTNGCTSPASQTLENASSVTISPDGMSVIVGSENAITNFARAADGTLSLAGCFVSGAISMTPGITGCTFTTVGSITGIESVAVSPDGSSLYGTTRDSDGVLGFAREIPPPAPAAPAAPATPAAPVPPDTILVSGPKKRHRGRSARFKIAAVGAAYKFECRMRRKAYTPCTSRMTVNDLRPGRKYTFYARAISLAGLVDPTPLSYSFRVAR